MKVFISQPMNGKSDEEILKTREAVTTMVKALYGADVEIIDSFILGAPHDAKPVWFLGEAIKKMNAADLVVFVTNSWGELPRGCEVERHVSMAYDIPTMEICYRNGANQPCCAPVPNCTVKG